MKLEHHQHVSQSRGCVIFEANVTVQNMNSARPRSSNWRWKCWECHRLAHNLRGSL